MKSNRIILIVLFATVLAGLLYILFLFPKSKGLDAISAETFSIEKYQWEIKTFSVNKNIGEINNENDAIEKAKSIWNEKYNVDINTVELSYDYEEECWHINSMWEQDMVGGMYHVIVRKNGDVIAVWVDD